MSKAYFTLGNVYCLARGKKDALVMSSVGGASDASSRCTAINQAVGADSFGAGKKVFVTLEQSGQTYVLDPSKKGKDLTWSTSLSLSKKQSFKVNMLDDRPFGVGASFGLSYRAPDTKATRYLCFGQGAEPLPVLSESSDNIMRLTISEMAICDNDSCSDQSGADEAAMPEPPPADLGMPVPVNAAASESKDLENDLEGGRYIVEFTDGPLGVKLKRSKKGVLLVLDIVPNSQAVDKGIQLGDKFCKIGNKDVSDHPIDDDEFNSIVSIIKDHPRPLPITFEHILAPSVVEAVAVPDSEASPPTPMDSSPPDTSEISLVTYQPTQQELDDQIALNKLAERLVIMPTGKSSGGSLAGLAAAMGKTRAANVPDGVDSSFGPFVLVKSGRRIIKHGELDVLGRGTLWNVKNSKYVFLLSDVILLTNVKGKSFYLESVIDHNVCKFDQAPRDVIGGKLDPMRFDIRWPGGTIEICFKDEDEKEMWSRALSDAVCHSVFAGKDYLSFGWRHMFIHGTLHAAILSRDEDTVRAIVAACESGCLDMSILDHKDEDFYTPLHYACILRQPKIAELLLNSHVDCTIPDNLGRTAFHWCAAQLDFPTLELLCARVFDVDITDDNNRTPLYVACVEGRDAQGRTNTKALSLIIELLVSSGANTNVTDPFGFSPLHYVAASLQFDAVDALLKAKAVVNVTSHTECAWSPLHYACAVSPLKKAIGEGHRTLHPGGTQAGPNDASDVENQYESIYVSDIGRTIGKLLEWGAWPNMKVGKAKSTPLQLLIMADGLGDPLFEIAAQLLVTSGARLDDISGPAARNDRFLELKEDLMKCHDEWTHRAPIDAASLALCLGAYLTQSSAISDASNATDITCSSCGFTFTMLKRKHRCRMCEVTCCDECSKKRITLESKEAIRCCDGCFNRVFAEVEAEKKAVFLANIKPLDSAIVINDLNRKQLFDGSSTANSDSTRKISDLNTETHKSTVASTANVLSEARQNLEERGEKLSQLADKTDKLAAASSDFAEMAKQLKKQQQRSSWWG